MASTLKQNTGHSVASSPAAVIAENVLADWINGKIADVDVFRQKAQLSPDHPKRWFRERFEMTEARVLILRYLLDEVPSIEARIVSDAGNLMGGKPDLLSALEAARAKHRQLAMHYAARVNDPMETRRSFADDQWNRHDSVSEFLESFLASFPGSAEEQPGPREESRPVTGKIPVTPGGANPPHFVCPAHAWVGSVPVETLSEMSEAILDELERRGESARWEPVAVS